MALPREVVVGGNSMATRRCSERRFFLLPREDTKQNFFYCLALAAKRYEVKVIFTLASTNHHHTGVHDPHGRLPDFMEHFHKLLARCQNAQWGRHEAMWASEQANVVQLIEGEDVLQKLVYALTNPVKDDLVEKAHHWPGASSLESMRRGTPIVARRPRHFFSEESHLPETIELEFHRPAEFESWTHEEWVTEIDRRIAVVEDEAARRRQQEGRRVLGRKGVLRQSWKSCPRSIEPRRGPKPRVSTSSKWARAETKQRRRAFLDAYRRARDALMNGQLPIVFPEGTYWRLKPLPFRTDVVPVAA